MKNPFKKSNPPAPQPFTYSSYRSSPRMPIKTSRRKPAWRSRRGALVMLVAVLIVAGGTAVALRSPEKSAVADKKPAAVAKKPVAKTPDPVVATTKPVAPAAATTPPTTQCTGNTLPKFISISITKRHLWGCEGANLVYDTPIITGMENLPADLTPTGTYHIYSKQTNQVLTGSDSTGSWNDPVSYWMPFLSNQYGIYGFHDATWRPDSEFGNIDPYSDKGSHGCVEMPLAASAWLYNWAPIGTTLTIVT